MCWKDLLENVSMIWSKDRVLLPVPEHICNLGSCVAEHHVPSRAGAKIMAVQNLLILHHNSAIESMVRILCCSPNKALDKVFNRDQGAHTHWLICLACFQAARGTANTAV